MRRCSSGVSQGLALSKKGRKLVIAQPSVNYNKHATRECPEDLIWINSFPSAHAFHSSNDWTKTCPAGRTRSGPDDAQAGLGVRSAPPWLAFSLAPALRSTRSASARAGAFAGFVARA